MFDTRRGIVYPSKERYQKIVEDITLLSDNKSVFAQTVLRLLGLMALVIDLSPWVRLHMRPIKFYLLSFGRPHRGSLLQSLPVKETLLQHMEWWKQLVPGKHFSGSVLTREQSHSVTLWTDAYSQGWGAHLNDHQISDTWSPQEKNCHVNWLEIEAVQLALIHFEDMLQKSRVLLRCNNSTVVSHFNREEGTKSFLLCCLIWEILQCRKSRDI
jgi:hypothetical protein